MSVALCAMSHSPLMGTVDPPPDVVADVTRALDGARDFVADFGPELVVVFAPDHYNGFLYDVMPPFCIGTSATSVGDYGLPTGDLRVDADTARAVTARVLDAGVDVACSERMRVDHAAVQPLKLLFGAADAVPVVPVFVNCVAEPLGPPVRSVALGRAVARALDGDPRRILFLASGGLSHDPPVPRLREAAPEVAERITVRREVTPAERHAREARTIAAARLFAAGESPHRDLNPDWDAAFLDACVAADTAAFTAQPPSWFAAQAGNSAHEVRTWLAAYAALGTHGPYTVTQRFYRPIREWFVGYAVTTAATTASNAHDDERAPA
ncbi:MAG: 3-carboxyethylcatechol 2,3-dioxygenase [Streptomycetaceae bacterium]|nr:3-carboxyethylcatechol 2,3-dioxygenase [Streptomycetaceae bacterium]